MTDSLANMTPELLTAVLGALAFGALTLYVAVGTLRQVDSRAVLLASATTFVWMLLLAVAAYPMLTALVQLGVYASWMLVMGQVMGGKIELKTWHSATTSLRWMFVVIVLAVIGGAALIVHHMPVSLRYGESFAMAPNLLLAQLALAILALGLLDQVRGNIHTESRWRAKFLVLGLFLIFGYDFILYTDALLFQGLDPTLNSARPAVHALAAPLFAIAVRRNRSQRLRLTISRRLAFQSTVLMSAGAYLLLMASAGYYVRLFGGQWGDVLQAFFIAAALVTFLVVAGSTDVRAWLRKSVANNLFEQRYDYRDEWQRLTRALVGGDPNEAMEVKALRVLTDIVHAPGGGLWVAHADGTFLALTQRNTDWIEPLTDTQAQAVRAYFSEHESIIDLRERAAHPERFPGVTAPGTIPDWEGSRFVLPLLLDEGLWGVAVLREPTIPTELDAEDRDLLELVARQTASFLAQRQASEALAQSRQLDAFNQMNAFVVHDVKTVVSQLSLLVRNSDKHRGNPAFLEDVISTTRHAVERMEKLLLQLRERSHDETMRTTDLRDVCEEALKRFNRATPRPRFEGRPESIHLQAPAGQLVEVVTHLLQNAVDATPADGRISLRLEAGHPWNRLTVQDTGAGMSANFIQEHLFAPFESTKGLTAMGIGVYQARQLIRSLGGDLLVRSKPGEGTRMQILLPNGTEPLPGPTQSTPTYAATVAS